MYESQWRPFETEVSGLKLELADRLSRQGKGRFELADCEVKSNWVRIPGEREKRSRFLHGLAAAEGNFYRRRQGTALDGLKVWPDRSALCALATQEWESYQQKTLRTEGQ